MPSNKTLRDEFAMLALGGLLAAHEGTDTALEIPEYADDAYRIADAMMRRRERNDAEAATI